MKYIRTEDGIYEIIVETDNFATIEKYGFYDFSNERGKHQYRLLKNKCRVADTIEELCDEYVSEWAGTYKMITKKEIWYYLTEGKTIYGAVWCEWGLKYVARMNLKGELELL